MAVLVLGYLIYGFVVEKIFGIDPARETPAIALRDNVDFTPLPTWKVFLIQFLNIAGLGPIFGAIMGVMFGPAAFLWISLGTIFAGGVHDFISAMISMRTGGSSLPEIVGTDLVHPFRSHGCDEFRRCQHKHSADKHKQNQREHTHHLLDGVAKFRTHYFRQ